jgi:dihydrodipicolinate synthase/N-acetylneuraminate lyase
MSGKRYRSSILATCCVPWNEDFTFAEEIFRRQVRHQLANGIRDLYIFGTAGEGYAVTEAQFDQITRVFLDETRGQEVQAMVGIISLALPTVIERIERARSIGARRFQLSLPSWGALRDSEVDIFFRETCGRFPDCEFLHYNLPRAQRLLTAAEYGRLAALHPNLVATKNSTKDLPRLRALQTEAPLLQHFITEAGFADAALLGECGLLISIASTNFAAGQAYFHAGRTRNEPTLRAMQQEFTRLITALLAVVGDRAHMDGAFDKVFCRLHDPQFPLRLLPPYDSITEEAFEQFAALLQAKHPQLTPGAHA